MSPGLRAPFPWFGGKSRAAETVWTALGDVKNYVEPFAGSLGVLLARPDAPRIETVNDLDCYVANFWRALAKSPTRLLRHCDGPVNEADLHARHLWLIQQSEFRERVRSEPEYFDAKIAGWWVWGLCSWIGSGWCAIRHRPSQQLPHLGNAGMGVHRPSQKLPHLGAGRGVHRPSQQLPHLGNAGRGVHRPSQQLPHLGDAGRGVHRPSQQLPHLGDAGRGRGDLKAYIEALAARLRGVRVACGDWKRVLSPAVTWRHGTTGILLDPPYSEGQDGLYAEGDQTIAGRVREWAIEHGDDDRMRIVLCGYEGEHDMPRRWRKVEWRARKGYAAAANQNTKRERVWLSPHCLRLDAARAA